MNITVNVGNRQTVSAKDYCLWLKRDEKYILVGFMENKLYFAEQTEVYIPGSEKVNVSLEPRGIVLEIL